MQRQGPAVQLVIRHDALFSRAFKDNGESTFYCFDTQPLEYLGMYVQGRPARPT